MFEINVKDATDKREKIKRKGNPSLENADNYCPLCVNSQLYGEFFTFLAHFTCHHVLQKLP